MGVYGLQIAGGINSTLDLATKITGAMGKGDKIADAFGFGKKASPGNSGGGSGSF